MPAPKDSIPENRHNHKEGTTRLFTREQNMGNGEAELLKERIPDYDKGTSNYEGLIGAIRKALNKIGLFNEQP